MAKIAFIIHGGICRSKQPWQDIFNTFDPEHQIKNYTTTHHGHSRNLALQAIKDGYTHIISVGGDGSVNEVANGIMDAKNEISEQAWNNIRMGIFPKGSGNDFVKSIQKTDQLETLKRVLEQDSFIYVDLGKIQFTNLQNKREERFFINISDVGIGGMVVEKAHQYIKWLGKGFNYQRAIISSLIKFKHQPIEMTTDSFEHKGKIMSLIIANGKYFGKGLGIAPDAEVDNGKFSLVLLGNVSLWDYVQNLKTIKACKHVKHPELSYHSAKTIQLNSEKPLPLDMDGEFIGYSPFTCEIVPGALKVLS